MMRRDKIKSEVWNLNDLGTWYIKPVLLFFLTLLVTITAVLLLHSNLKAKAEERFNRHIAVAYQAVEEQIETYIAMLRATSGLFAMKNEVTVEEFRLYTNQLNLSENYPGVQGIGYSVNLLPNQVEEFQLKMRSQGHNDFKVWPETPRDTYHSIAFLEPLDERNKAAIGYDMFYEPTRRAAMEQARDTGEPAASGKVILVQEIDEDVQAGFLIYLPIYETVITPDTVGERRRYLQGFVYSPFRVGDLLGNIFGRERPNVEFYIYDGENIEADNLLYQSKPYGIISKSNLLPTLTATESLTFAGRTWTIFFTPGPGFNRTLNFELVALLFLAGLLVSLLIGWLTFKEVKARKKTAESERLFRHIFNFQFQFMVILSPEGRVQEINELPLQVGGTDREAVIGKFFWETSWWAGLPHMVKAWPDRLKEASQANHSILSRDEFRAADGSVRVADASITAVKNENGLVRFFIVQATDITERLKAEEEITKAKDRLAIATQTALDAVVVVDEQSIITEWNPQAEKTFGWNRDEAIGRSMAEMIIPPEYRKAHYSGMSRFLRSGEHNILDQRIELSALDRKGRKFPVELTITAQQIDGSYTFVAFLRDITQRKEAEEHELIYTQRLEEANDKLVEAKNQLEKADQQKNEFLAILGHELRNPLAAIAGGIQVLQIMPDQAEEMIGTMDKSVRLISSLLDDMLDLTRISRGQIRLRKKVFDLRIAIEAAVTSVKQSIRKKSQAFHVTLPEEPLWINADPVRIEQIIINLLTNARKYTQEGGKIEFNAEEKGNRIVITIKDNGQGIEPDMLEKIFEPFTRTADSIGSPGSLGIGLALVKQITVKHGGTVKAKSDGAGKGAEFIVRLPLAESLGEKMTIEKKQEPSDESQLEGLRVMLVDDNLDAMIGTEVTLQQKGCKIKKVVNAEQAIESAKTFKADVFLLDIGMPGMNGYELARYLRENSFKDALIIAVSGFGHEDAHNMSKKYGINNHLNKPLDYKALIQVITSHMRNA